MQAFFMKLAVHGSTLAACCALGTAALAQGDPQHPITVVVPFSAGGAADIAARNLAPVAQRVLGQPIVPMNRAGASGAIGSQAVRAAKPDGSTLLLACVGSQVVLPVLRLGRQLQIALKQ